MKLGLFTALFSNLSLDEVIPRVKSLGIEAVEFATGNYGAAAHVQLEWRSNLRSCENFGDKLDNAGLVISALGCGGKCASSQS